MNTEMLGNFLVENGETVWAVHRVAEMPDLSKLATPRIARFYKGASEADLRKDQLRMLALSVELDGSRTLWDFAGTYSA
jgi:hypothetical protein